MWEEIKKTIEKSTCRLRICRDNKKQSVQDCVDLLSRESLKIVDDFNNTCVNQKREEVLSSIADIAVKLLNAIGTVHVHEVPTISKFTLEYICRDANLSVVGNPAKVVANYLKVVNKVISDSGNRKVAVVKTLVLLYHISKNMGYDFFKLIEERLKEIESVAGEYNEKKKEWVEDKSQESLLKRYTPKYEDCKLNG